MQHIEFELHSEDGLKLYAQEWVPDDETRGLVCVIHGLGEHSGRYAHLGKFLATNAFAMITYDLRGHGNSDGPRGHSPNLEALYSDISILIEHAETRIPDRPIFLYGHSLGGNLVLNYTIRESSPVNAVIATGPILRPAFEPPAWKISLGRLTYRLLPTLAMSNELDRDALSKDPDVVHAYNTDPLVHDRVTARLAIDMLDTGLWLLDNASRLRLPTLIIHGGEDRICSAPASQEFAEKVGEICTLKIWEGLFHETHNEPEKEEVFKFTLTWINGHLTR